MSHMKTPLTTSALVGTMKEGGEDTGPSRQKSRRPKGAPTKFSMDTLLRLHTYFRDYAQLMKSEDFDLSAYEVLAMMAFELAELLKEEYDKRHG